MLKKLLSATAVGVAMTAGINLTAQAQVDEDVACRETGPFQYLNGDGTQAVDVDGNPLEARGLECGEDADAGAARSTAVGSYADALGYASTAVGRSAFVAETARRGTAIGRDATIDNQEADPATADDETINSINGTAVGEDAYVLGDNSIAIGNVATVTGNWAVAIGQNSEADGDYNTAIGQFARARGVFSTALGQAALAEGEGASAIGQNSQAVGNRATALGEDAWALFENSAAIGARAQTQFANQFMFGTASNTYTMPGLTSQASRDAQSGPLSLVLSDASGNLAIDGSNVLNGILADIDANTGLLDDLNQAITDGNPSDVVAIAAVNAKANDNQERVTRVEASVSSNTTQISLMNTQFETLGLQIDALGQQVSYNTEQIQENTAGIAIANAMAGTSWLQANETHALTANWGYYNNSNALAISAAQRLNKNWSANAGVGVSTDEGKIGARAGIRYGW